MALIVADRVRENSTTTGTGTLTLSGSPLGYQTFSSAVGNGNTTYYAISNPGVNEWEVGIGTVGAGTLARTTVLASSTGTSLVSFTAGTKDVFCTYPAEVSVFAGNTQTLTNKTISVDDNTVSGIAASSFVVSNASGNIDGTAAQKVIPTGAVVGTTDTQTLTNKTISGANNTLSNIGNASLSNSSVTVGSTNIALGATSTTLAGLTSVTSSSFVGPLTGNADTVTNGVYTVGDQTIGGTKTFSSNPVLNGGTANGVSYLNGSKVLTTGSALTFDGTNLSINSSNALRAADIGSSVQAYDADLTSWAGIAPSAKQDALVSGTNIKTVNGSSVLGSGNLAVGSVTSVGMTVPTGLSVSGTPITSSGTFALSLATGYSIPTTASQTNWDTAYADRNKWDGGATGLVAATGRASLGLGTAATMAGPSGAIVGTTDTQILTNKTVEAATFTNGYTEEVATANTGTAYTIDLANGSIQKLTLTGNCTYTFPTATAGQSFVLYQLQDATGSRTVTWPASVKWPSGTAPTLTSTASKADIFAFTADGTNWLGRTIGQAYL